MPSVTDVQNLTINFLKKAQFDTAVQQGIIGANELSIISDMEATVDIDDALSTSSTNPVQNKVITEKIEELEANSGGPKCINMIVHSDEGANPHITVTDGVVGGFGVDNYLEFPVEWSFVNKKPQSYTPELQQAYEFEFGIMPLTEYESDYTILFARDNMWIILRNDMYLEFMVNPFGDFDDNSWGQWDNGVPGVDPILFEANKAYRLKITFDCDGWDDDLQDEVWSYKLYASDDGGTTYKLQVIHKMVGMDYVYLPNASKMYFGCNPTADQDYEQVFSGKIDLNNAYLKVYNELIWNGIDSVGLLLKSSTDLNNITSVGKNNLAPISPNLKVIDSGFLTNEAPGIYTGFSTYDYFQYQDDLNRLQNYNNWELRLGFQTTYFGNQPIILSEYGIALSIVYDENDDGHYLRFQVGDGTDWTDDQHGQIRLKQFTSYDVKIAYNRQDGGEFVILLSEDGGNSWFEDIYSYNGMFTASKPLLFCSSGEEEGDWGGLYFYGYLDLSRCSLTANWHLGANSNKKWTSQLIWTGMHGTTPNDFANLDLENLSSEAARKLLPMYDGAAAGSVLHTDGTDTYWGQITPQSLGAVPQYSSMPEPSVLGIICQYKGATTQDYTNGYFYKSVQAYGTATISQTAGSSLSNIAIDVVEFQNNYPDLHGTDTYAFYYDGDGSTWMYGDGNQVDMAAIGITYSGTPADADELTVDYTAPASSVIWTQIDVQPSSGGGGSVPTLTWYSVSTAGNTLTIADTSSAQLVKIYKNGLLLQPTEDYTISGTTLTTVGALVVGDKITTEVF